MPYPQVPRTPHNGPIYMALHAPGALLLELSPALWTHLREHFGGHATLYPHRPPVSAPMYLQPRTEPGIWFHDLSPLATIRGAMWPLTPAPPGRHDNGDRV